GAGFVTNAGTITGTNDAGVGLRFGGTVDNSAGTAVIDGGGNGIAIYGAPGSVTNAGTIATGFDYGVVLSGGGSVTNLAHGTIVGGAAGNGVSVSGTLGSVTNAGLITGGVVLHATGGVDNLSTGTITGGVHLHSDGTLTNAGTISAGTDAVIFAPGSVARVIFDPGAEFVGTVSGGNAIGAAAVSTLELAAGTGTGTITGLGVQFIDFAQTTIDAGASWNLDGASTLVAGATLTAEAGAAAEAAGSLVNNGLILLVGGALTVGTLSGGGTVTIGAGATLDVTGSVAAGQSIALGLGGMLRIGDVLTNDATIANGIALTAPETVYNLAAGVIGGGFQAFARNDTLINAGYVSGGVVNGSDTNLSTGTIVGAQYGVYVGRGTFTNAGSIRGGTDAVEFGSYANASFTDRLIVDPGATFSGTVDGGNTIGTTLVSTLELAASTTVGTIAALGTQFVDFAQVTIDPGAQWALEGASSLAAGTGLTNAGTLTVQNGSFTDTGSIVNDGLIQVLAATLTASDLTGTGQVTVGAGGLLLQNGSLTVNDRLITASGSVNPNLYSYSRVESGVYLTAGQTLTNLAGGTIAGAFGVYLQSGSASVTNAGVILSQLVTLSSGHQVGPTSAVYAPNGGDVSNLRSGTIAGPDGGEPVIFANNVRANVAITNAGVIQGTLASYGIAVGHFHGIFPHSIEIVNTGTIIGGPSRIGVAINSGVSGGVSTIVNAGTIIGGLGAVANGSSSGFCLIVDPGAAFEGSVNGGNTIGAAAVSTLELAAGTIAGTITALGSQFVNFAQTTIDAGAQWTLAGANALAAGATLANAGTLVLANGTLAGAGALVNGGTIALPTGSFTVDAGALAGAGSLLVEGTAALTLNAGSVLPGQQIAFAPAPGITGGGTLTLDAPAGFAGTIAGYTTGDQIVVETTAAAGFAYAVGGSVIAVQDLVAGQPTGSQEGRLTFATATAAQQAYTDITNPTPSLLDQLAPCYAAGTRIAAAHGSVPVERLRAGDLLRTAGGALRPVRWIGHRTIDLTRHPDPRRAQPIRIAADAFADGIPARDLLLSPDHAVFDRGRLIPVRLLVNGATITRETRRRKIAYYHVELDSHDLLLAEGLAAESYLDCNNRGLFENAAEPLILHPDFLDPAAQAARRLAASCAPLIDAAELVAPLWWRLADRAIALGLAVPSPRFTIDPGLKLRSGGRVLAPVARDGATFRFALQAGPATLLSRAAYPQDATPWLEDQRRLGVMVRALRLDGAPVPLDHPALAVGWWAPETDGVAQWRWTNGAASLGILTAPASLEVTLGDTPRYPRARRSRAA
ncbi:MAG: Hint domain-containing protein, partial [Acetobacteraceae bacterium]